MVTIIDFKERKMDDGNTFYVLILQGGIETKKSVETGKIYFTKKVATVPTTFDEMSCKELIGKKLNGSIQKVKCDPYDYENDKTGEMVEYSTRNVYVDEDMEIVKENVIDELVVK